MDAGIEGVEIIQWVTTALKHLVERSVGGGQFKEVVQNGEWSTDGGKDD